MPTRKRTAKRKADDTSKRLDQIEKTLGTLCTWLHPGALRFDEVDKLLCMLNGITDAPASPPKRRRKP